MCAFVLECVRLEGEREIREGEGGRGRTVGGGEKKRVGGGGGVKKETTW